LTRPKPTGSDETPGNPGVSSSSTSDHPIPPSRQKTTQLDPNRPLRATEGATGFRVVAPPVLPADLQRIVDAWPGLPESVRASILMLVKAAGK
jgi:hypothetical protein